jgi:hypothetical protein
MAARELVSVVWSSEKDCATSFSSHMKRVAMQRFRNVLVYPVLIGPLQLYCIELWFCNETDYHKMNTYMEVNQKRKYRAQKCWRFACWYVRFVSRNFADSVSDTLASTYYLPS